MRNLQRQKLRRPANRIVHAESSGRKSVDQSRLRLMCVAVFFALSFGALGLRLIEVSLVGSGALPFKKLVSEPQLLLAQEEDVDVAVAPQKVTRRDIVDRNGRVIATSVATASLAANPTLIRHDREVAEALAALIPGIDRKALHARLANKHSSFVYIKRHLTPAQQEAVNNLGVPGLFFEPDSRRVYPYGNLLAHVLGFVGVDNQGLAGIERSYDRALMEPWHEKPLQLSIDVRVQAMLADELVKAVKTYRAIGATGVVADIKTGEVVAMVNLPDFDPNQPQKASADARFNRASLGAYEMGSVFKTFTTAAALDAGVVGMRGGYDATKPIKVSRFMIRDAHPENRWLSVPEIFAYSSNIGTVKMAMDVGTPGMKEFLNRLGMFKPVATQLPEVANPIIPRDWREINTMTISYGHGISVSPLHVVRAFAALAGDGMLRPLVFVRGQKMKGETTGPVAKPETIARVRELLRIVVAHGTAKGANAAGYAVGGKTGTAEKVSGRGYKHDAKLASFVGVFPSFDPKYVILAMIDEPKGTKATYGYATGGWVAAPMVGSFVQRAAPALGLMPAQYPQEKAVEAIWLEAEARAKAAIQKAKGISNASF